MLAPNAPTGSYNADFSNVYAGSYRFIWAVSKIYLLRHEKINKSYAAKPRNTPLCMYIHTNDAQKKKSFSPSLCQTNTFLLPFPQPCSGRSLVGAGEQKSLSHTTSSCCGRAHGQSGARRTMTAWQTKAARPRGWRPAPGTVPASRKPRLPQQAGNNLIPWTAPVTRNNSPPRLWRSSPTNPELERQHKAKQRTTSALSSHWLPSSEIREVEYQQNVCVKGLHIFTREMPTEIRY